MGSLIFIGLLVIGLFPAGVILLLFLYKIYNGHKMKNFERNGNLVLTRERIGEVFDKSKPSNAIRVLNSAICEHADVNGIKYYTRFPFGMKLMMAHDDHRRAFIAYKIGQMLTKEIIVSSDFELCKDILLRLIDHFKETYYTQLFAWNSLSILARFQKGALLEDISIEYLKTALTGYFITGIGVVKFIFNLKENVDLEEDMSDFLDEIILHMLEKASCPLIALFLFKLNKSASLKKTQKRYFIDHLPQDPKLNNFLKYIDSLSLGFTRDEMIEGLKNLGLKAYPYSKNTTEGEIVQFLLKDFLEEIYVPTSYTLHSYNWDESRQQLSNFLWV